MDNPHTIVIVGDRNGNQAKLQTQIEPVHFRKQFALGVKSFFHGEVFNINETNNLIHFSYPDYSPLALESFKNEMSYSDEDLKNIPAHEFPKQSRTCTLPVGYYPSVISVLEKISIIFQNIMIPTRPESETLIEPLNFICNLKRNGFIECYAKNFIIITWPHSGPWALLNLDIEKSVSKITNENLFYFNYGRSIKLIQNRTFAKDLEPSYVYVNIIQNSYVNSKRAKVLCVLPIRMKAD